MKYMMFVKHSEHFRSLPVPAALNEAMGKFVTDALASGKLLDTAGLKPTAAASLVTLKGGKISVTDGPFTEAKEMIGGYAIVNVDSHAEALAIANEFMELHRLHWPEFEGSSEVRPLEEF